MSKILTIKQNIVFIFFLILAFVNKISPIDIEYFNFIMVGVFFIVSLFFKTSFSKKVIMVFLFSVFCTMRTKFKIQGYTVNLRAEDFITIIMAIYLLWIFIKKEFKLKKIDIIILAYIIYNIIVLSVNCILKNNEPMYFMILIKEIQYFVYFMFFRNAIKEKEDSKFILQVFVYCSLVNIIWGIYQIIQKSVSYYGIACLTSDAPAHSGGVFFIISILFIYLFGRKNNILYLLLALIASVLTCFVISRTSIIVMAFAISVYCIFDISLIIRGKKSKKSLIIYVIIVLCMLGFFINFEKLGEMNIYIGKIISRFSRFNIGSSVRFNKWIDYFETSKTLGVIFGNGKGFSQNLRNVGFKLATDSQYVCSILESGIIGTLIWLWMLFEISLKQFFKKQFNHETVMLCIIVASYLLIGITIEVFQTVLQATLFWCLVGMWYKYNELNQPSEVLLIGESEEKPEKVLESSE